MSGTLTNPIVLNEEQQRFCDLLEEACKEDIRRMAVLLADKDDSNLLGETEFKLRDRVHALGARALEGNQTGTGIRDDGRKYTPVQYRINGFAGKNLGKDGWPRSRDPFSESRVEWGESSGKSW